MEKYVVFKKMKLLNINNSPQISEFNNPNFKIKQENNSNKKNEIEEEIMKKIEMENYYKNPFKFMEYLAKKYFIENANTLENLKIKQEMTTNFKKLCNQIKNDISNYTRNEEMYLKEIKQNIEKLNGDSIAFNQNLRGSVNNNQEKGKFGDIGNSKNLISSPMTMDDKEFLTRVMGNEGFYGGSPMDGIITNTNALNYVNSNKKNSELNDDNLYKNALSCLKGDKLIAPKSKFIAVKELSLNDIDQNKIKDTQNIIDLKNKMKIEQYNNEIMGKNKDKNYKKIKNNIELLKNNEKNDLEDLILNSNIHINNMKQYQKEKNDLINNLKNKLNKEYNERAIKFAMDKLLISEKNLNQIQNDKNINNIPQQNLYINWKKKKEDLEKEYNDLQATVNNFLKGRGISTNKKTNKRNENKKKKKKKRNNSSFPYNTYYKNNYYNYK